MTQPINCCLCREPFSSQREMSDQGEHAFHVDCASLFIQNQENTHLQCSHLADRRIELVPLVDDHLNEEEEEREANRACCVVCVIFSILPFLLWVLVKFDSEPNRLDHTRL